MIALLCSPIFVEHLSYPETPVTITDDAGKTRLCRGPPRDTERAATCFVDVTVVAQEVNKDQLEDEEPPSKST